MRQVGLRQNHTLITGQTLPDYLRGGLLAAVCGIPLGFTLVSFLLGGLAFRRLGTPFADIMSATDAIANGGLSVRLQENDRRGPWGNLARRFNNMVAELERAEQQRRNLTADIAHELRTPLHIIQGNLEGMLDGVYEPTEANITDTLDERYKQRVDFIEMREIWGTTADFGLRYRF